MDEQRGGQSESVMQSGERPLNRRGLIVARTSSRLVWFFGFMFLGLATFDVIRHRLDGMTSTYMFFGLLAFAVAYCLQNIEKRLASIEQSLK